MPVLDVALHYIEFKAMFFSLLPEISIIHDATCVMSPKTDV